MLTGGFLMITGELGILMCGFMFLSAMQFLEGKRVCLCFYVLFAICSTTVSGACALLGSHVVNCSCLSSCFVIRQVWRCKHCFFELIGASSTTALLVLVHCVYAQRCVSISVESSSIAVSLVLCTTSATNPKSELRSDLGVLADLTTSECCDPLHWVLIQ